MGKAETTPFLKTFSEVKIELSKFAKNNINSLSCKAVMLEFRDHIIPKESKDIREIVLLIINLLT